jgi:hypothetical protein
MNVLLAIVLDCLYNRKVIENVFSQKNAWPAADLRKTDMI